LLCPRPCTACSPENFAMGYGYLALYDLAPAANKLALSAAMTNTTAKYTPYSWSWVRRLRCLCADSALPLRCLCAASALLPLRCLCAAASALLPLCCLCAASALPLRCLCGALRTRLCAASVVP
jgi:hypothetical protein